MPDFSGHPLGRTTPKTWEHVEKYPLSAAPASVSAPTPVVIGVNWHTDFDTPEKYKGRWWVARSGIHGSVRGGHCVCIPPNPSKDPRWCWSFYNQGKEGACVGFGSTRMMSLLNRTRYDAWWLWDQAKLADEWPDTMPGDDNGTSVHAAFDVLRTKGHVPWKKQYADMTFQQRDALAPDADAGISANRWAQTVDEVLAVLQNPLYEKLGAVPFLNSWGKVWPHVVWLPLSVLETLINEEGEVGLPTDR